MRYLTFPSTRFYKAIAQSSGILSTIDQLQHANQHSSR